MLFCGYNQKDRNAWKRDLQATRLINMSATHAQFLPKSDIFGFLMVARILTAGH